MYLSPYSGAKKQEYSSGAVIFHSGKPRLYLILKYGLSHWDFPKGHVEAKETPQQAALREVNEETGLTSVRIYSGFQEDIRYFYRLKGELVAKRVTYFLAETVDNLEEVRLSYEHVGYKWLPYKDALKQLTFKNSKDVLRKAESFLKSTLHDFVN